MWGVKILHGRGGIGRGERCVTEGRLREETQRHTERRHILWICLDM